MINSVAYGSTGHIMFGIADYARNKGYIVKTYSGKWRNQVKIIGHEYFGSFLENCFHEIIAPAIGLNDCLSFFGTLFLITDLKRFNPDIIHLHNLHTKYICIPLLFKYIKKNNIKVIWTLHDCWAFTGHCTHFTMSGCNKWRNGCTDCDFYKNYPSNFWDNSKLMYSIKKKVFTGISNMLIVTPSVWLSKLVKESFLKDYPVKVINNGINTKIFRPVKSNKRNQYGIDNNKYIILGVSFVWGKSKGLDVFIKLSEELDEKYQIVLVGTDDKIDKLLPDNIIAIHRTHNQEELAELYTFADVFVNPTREENFPTVNMEAISCGTPVITYNSGGSSECLDETSGSIVECDDFEGLKNEIVRICNNKPYLQKDCIARASQFQAKVKYREYISLYEEICNG